MTPTPNAHDLRAVDRHGDQDVEPGIVDLAVNVRPGPPDFLVEALRRRLADLGRYPTTRDEQRAIDAVATAHGRRLDEVMLLSGVAEGFELLPRLRPRHAALIEPSFTEPAVALRASGIRTTHVVLGEPWQLTESTAIPEDADLVVIGNPTNPTSVLHPAESILALRRPGRLIVVDEAFADLTLDPDRRRREPETVASQSLPDVIVMRSITKTFAVAGLRVGYLLAAPDIIARLSAGRRPWAVGTLGLTALAECVGPVGESYCATLASEVASDRDILVSTLDAAGLRVCAEPDAPFVLITVPSAFAVKNVLRDKGFSIRSAANFVGLGDDHVRLAVRDEATTRAFVDALVWATGQVPARQQTTEGRHR